MAWSFDPSAWTTATKPSVANFQSIATDLHTRGGVVDGGAYGRANTGFLTLNSGALPGTTYTVTGASWSTSVATLTIGAHVILVNQLVVVSSVVPTGYNGTVVITAVTGTTISFALASNPGAYTSGGSVLVGGVTAAEGMLAINGSGVLQKYTSGSWTTISGTGTVTNTGTLTANALLIGNGGSDLKVMPALSWTAPTLLNSWANTGSGNVAAGYTIDGFGFVHIQGFITAGTTTAGTTLFVLPSGYRPTAAQIFVTAVNAGSSVACTFLIDTSGNVKIFGGWSGITQVALAANFSIF